MTAPALWERIADELEASRPGVSRSTMMGLPCLRLDGAFFASLDTRAGSLVVKLAADEVSARVADGHGRAFAPAGKVFREWIVVEGVDEATWRAALEDALTFARSGRAPGAADRHQARVSSRSGRADLPRR